MGKNSLIDRVIRFIGRDIWMIRVADLPRIHRFAIKQAQIIYIVARDFFKDDCSLRASALTYTTLLSLVPLLAFVFALVTAFKMDISVLKEFIVENVALGNEEIGTEMFNYVSNINAATMGAPALAILVFTVISVMSTIEGSFNRIWGVSRPRSFWRRFSNYLTILLITPVFVIAGATLAGTLGSHQVVTALMRYPIFQTAFLSFFKLIPWGLTCLGFCFLYLYMPNTRVKFKSALIGGVIAGILWQSALWGYITFQVGFVQYAKIYGALAQIPILLVWVYISWLIVLLGAEISFANQNVQAYRKEEFDPLTGWGNQELMALAILERIGLNFLQGKPPLNAEKISPELNLPLRSVNIILEKLVQSGLINELGEKGNHYQPSRDLSGLRLREIVWSLRYSGSPPLPPELEDSTLVKGVKDRLEAAFAGPGANPSFRELLEKRREPEASGTKDKAAPSD